MAICHKIIGSSKRAKEIMRTRPINSLRVVSRNAKNTKDPNPLQTTLSTMSTKYPLSVDISLAKKHGVPEDLMCVTKKDTHQHGRVLAKMEIVDWWVSNSPLPSESSIEVIDILREHPRREAKYYSEINFEESQVRFGTFSLERRFVKQRNPLLSMPKELRDAAILQTLAPSVVTPHIMIPEYIREGLKKMAETTLSDKILFAHQVRIMSSQLNPKMRYAPAIPQSDDITGPIRHAICQGNRTLTGYLLPQVEKSTETQKTVQALCISLCQ